MYWAHDQIKIRSIEKEKNSPMNENMTMVRATVHGKVQGVGFRAATVQQARLNGLTGWVRNAADGTVEVLAQGSADAIDNFLSWLHKGPPSAQVVQVDIADGYITQRYFKHFEWR